MAGLGDPGVEAALQHPHPAAIMASSPPGLSHMGGAPPPAGGHGASAAAYPHHPHHAHRASTGSQRGHPNGRPINGNHGRNRQNSNNFEGARSPPGAKNLSHVPCKFFRIGQCQAGNACPFSHDFENGEQPCKYFAKGNCKFGPKCANLHVDQYGRVVNRPQKSLAAFNIGGRSDHYAFQQQQQQQAAAMGVHIDDMGPTPFNNQIPPISDFDPSASPVTKPYDIPGSHQTQFGSPPEEIRFPMSPPLIRNINEVGLPSSFDSKGSSSMFKRGPVAASVPSKFFTAHSPPSSMPKNGLLTAEAVRGLRDSGIDSRSKGPVFGSSPLGMMEEEPAPRMMHSQRMRPRGLGGMMSTSLPVREDWETGDEDDFFGDQEEYVPKELLNSQILSKDDARVSSDRGGTKDPLMGTAPRDFVRNGNGQGVGFSSPDFGPKIGSPSMASPGGSSRFTDLFNEQRRKEASNPSAAANSSGSAFGPVGSPLRGSGFTFGSHSPQMVKSRADSMSALTAGLQNVRINRAASTSTDSAASPNLGAVGSSSSRGPHRASADRTISSTSVSQRIDEESIFALEVDDMVSVPRQDKTPDVAVGSNGR